MKLSRKIQRFTVNGRNIYNIYYIFLYCFWCEPSISNIKYCKKVLTVNREPSKYSVKYGQKMYWYLIYTQRNNTDIKVATSFSFSILLNQFFIQMKDGPDLAVVFSYLIMILHSIRDLKVIIEVQCYLGKIIFHQSSKL